MVRLRSIFHYLGLLAPMLASIHSNCTNVSYMVKRDFEEKQKPAKNRRFFCAEALKRGKNVAAPAIRSPFVPKLTTERQFSLFEDATTSPATDRRSRAALLPSSMPRKARAPIAAHNRHSPPRDPGEMS